MNNPQMKWMFIIIKTIVYFDSTGLCWSEGPAGLEKVRLDISLLESESLKP